MTTTLTADHPGWLTGPAGELVRLVIHEGLPWLATWRPGTGLVLHAIGAHEASAPPAGNTKPNELPTTPSAAPLVQHLVTLGNVQRLTNPSLWDAISTAILRQVVRAEQARKVYHRWCTTHGRTIETAVGPLSLTPDPETVLDLPDAAFAETGTAFHRSALRAAATAYIKHRATWTQLTPEDLVKALDDVPRIGPWTASAATADYTGDFSVYPHGDLAVRTWARRVAPDMPLPDTDRAFARQWHGFADNSRAHLHALTLYTLTWGSHARSAQSEGTADLP